MARSSLVRGAALALLAGSVAVATPAFRADVDAQQATPFAGPSKGDPAQGKKVYASKCVPCHKADGSGGIKLTGNPTPNWRDAKRMADPQYSDDYLRDCITNGKPKSGMVAWSKSGVKPAEIENLIAYIRTFAKK